MNDEFYIGYEARAPAGLARFTRRLVLGLALAVAALAGLVAARQTPAEPGRFEFGVRRDFEGVLHELPLPVLRVPGGEGSVTNLLLVGAGKHGLPAFARGHDGARVRFRGSLIQQGASLMVEMNDAASFTVLDPAPAEAARPAAEDLGRVSLAGELVDTKCWFGVMRPAAGKVHRACAARCLSGGIPPGLLLRDAAGGGVVVLLTGSDGGPLKFPPAWAARVVRAEGRLAHDGNLLTLAVDLMGLARP